MPRSRQPEDPGAERRAARDRRKRRMASAGGTDAVLLLLAKLLAVLTGVFVGLFIAYFISFLFISPVEILIDKAEDDIKQTQTEIQAAEPEFVRADTQYRRLKTQRERALREGQGATSPTAGLGEPSRDPDTLTVAPTLEELGVAESEFRKADNQLAQLNSRLRQYQTDIADYQRTILILNLLSAAVVLILALLGYLLYPVYYKRLQLSTATWGALFVQRSLRAGPLLIGFFGGIVLAMLVLLALFTTLSTQYTFLSLPLFRLAFGAFITVLLGICGALIGASYFSPPPPEADPYEDLRRPAAPNLLDSSVLIDGRIYEVAVNGFLQGALVVPKPVMDELQTMADSGDERKRLKGRRGLDMINKLKGDSRLDVAVHEDPDLPAQGRGADDYLIALARAMGANVVTNDSNLNRVALARDVRVININALANAVKTNLLPGDYLDLDITDRGKQRGQGVGYLPDGTMVVVEDGEAFIGEVKTIKLTSISQTQAGRLLFGRVDLASGNGRPNGGHG